MRRSRDAAGGVDSTVISSSSKSNNLRVSSPLSGFDLYGVQGDAASALERFTDTESESSPTLAAQYNCLWLSQIVRSGIQGQESQQINQQQAPTADAITSDTLEAFLEKLDHLEQSILAPVASSTANSSIIGATLSVSQRRRQRNTWILAYNRALAHFAAGNVPACASICAQHLAPLILQYSSKKQKQAYEASTSFDDVAFVASCRLAMLWLECILAWTVGKNPSSDRNSRWQSLHKQSPSVAAPETGSDNNSLPSIESIMAWLEHVIVTSGSGSNSSKSGIKVATDTTEQQLKFLLPVYKSRLALAEFDDTGKRMEACVRLARKDMKTAMEVFQNKLRPAFGGGGQDASSNASVVSSGNSEDGNSRHQGAEPHFSPSSSTIHNVVLQKLNQSALSIKAHLEQLKGNTKKSLILCSEAVGATTTAEDAAAYEPLHGNNLAVVYETNNRRYLALHALSKSLRAVQQRTRNCSDKVSNGNDEQASDSSDVPLASLFHSDGTARPDVTVSILYNTALCSLRARRYTSAYECMAACISQSTMFANRPTSCLRLAEACMGIFADKRQRESQSPIASFSTIEKSEGEPQGIFLRDALFNTDGGFVRESLVAHLGSPDDVEQVQRNPLLRACDALQRVVQHGQQGNEKQHLIESDALTSARLTLAYVYLVQEEYRRALSLAEVVVESLKTIVAQDDISRNTESQIVRRLHRKQFTHGRMYAAEACCALGDMAAAMAYLVGDGKDDAFDRLASDLSGVTLEVAAANEAAKRKLAHAQSMVSSSASAVTAAMGNHRVAKQLAQSARAMEGDIFESSREKSLARRALIYTLLCEGSQSSAITMLLSS